MRLLLVAALLAACSAPPPGTDGAGIPTDPTLGGLSGDQLDALQTLGIPALVPEAVGAFELVRFEADTDGRSASYALGYRRADGACIEVSGTNDGLGAPPWPLVSTETTVRDLNRTVRVYQAGDDPSGTNAQVWGVGTVVSEIIDVDGTGVLVLSDTQNGCRPVSLAEGAAIVSSLRLLTSRTPAAPREPSTFGDFAPADDLLDGSNEASSPALAADSIAARYDGAADDIQVEIIDETDTRAVALVTALGLPDDSIRDERLRLDYRRSGGVWRLVSAGRQVRCWPGRGHTTWSPDACI